MRGDQRVHPAAWILLETPTPMRERSQWPACRKNRVVATQRRFGVLGPHRPDGNVGWETTLRVHAAASKVMRRQARRSAGVLGSAHNRRDQNRCRLAAGGATSLRSLQRDRPNEPATWSFVTGSRCSIEGTQFPGRRSCDQPGRVGSSSDPGPPGTRSRHPAASGRPRPPGNAAPPPYIPASFAPGLRGAATSPAHGFDVARAEAQRLPRDPLWVAAASGRTSP